MKKLTIDYIPDGFVYAAVDSDGYAYAYTLKPYKSDTFWVAGPGRSVILGNGFDASDWQNSLIFFINNTEAFTGSININIIPDGYYYAAVDADGHAYAFKSKPVIKNGFDFWSKSKNDNISAVWLGKGFDASDWQNSLISIDGKAKAVSKLPDYEYTPPPEPTRAAKDQTNKPSFAEIDPEFLLAMAERITANKGKYEPFNWQKPCDINLLLDAAQRHLLALRMPEQEGAEETHLDHAVALALNSMIIHYQLRHNERTPKQP